MDTFELEERASEILGAMVHEWGPHLSLRNAFGMKVAAHLRFRKTGSRFIKPKRYSSRMMFARLRNIRELSEADLELASKTFEGVLKSFKILSEALPEMGLDGEYSLRHMLQQFANRWNINEQLVKVHIERVKILGSEAHYQKNYRVWTDEANEAYKTRYAVRTVLSNFCSRVLCIFQQLMRALKNKNRRCSRLLAQAKLVYLNLNRRNDFSELVNIVPALRGYKPHIFARITVKEAESILALNAYLKKKESAFNHEGVKYEFE